MACYGSKDSGYKHVLYLIKFSFFTRALESIYLLFSLGDLVLFI